MLDLIKCKSYDQKYPIGKFLFVSYDFCRILIKLKSIISLINNNIIHVFKIYNCNNFTIQFKQKAFVKEKVKG